MQVITITVVCFFFPSKPLMTLCFYSREVHQHAGTASKRNFHWARNKYTHTDYKISQCYDCSPLLSSSTLPWYVVNHLTMSHHFMPRGRWQLIPAPSVMLIFSWPNILLTLSHLLVPVCTMEQACENEACCWSTQHDFCGAVAGSIYHYEDNGETESYVRDRDYVHWISSMPSYSAWGPSRGPDTGLFQTI